MQTLGVHVIDCLLTAIRFQESKRILGVHIIGTDACELVHYGMDLVEKKATIFDVIGELLPRELCYSSAILGSHTTSQLCYSSAILGTS